MNTGFSIKVLILAIVLLLASSCLFTVKEYESGVVLRFKEIIRDDQGITVLYKPGIHFKIPLIDKVVKVDSRLQSFDEQTADEIPAKNNIKLRVNSYVKWKIIDIEPFYKSASGELGRAEEQLNDIVDGLLRTEIGHYTVDQMIENAEVRQGIMDKIRLDASIKTKEFGVEVIDFRIKKMDFPEASINSIYKNMTTEREQLAAKTRADGQKTADIIRAEANAKVNVISSDADQQARRIRGDGDAQAAQIFAKTYNKNPEFYAFLRSLDAYKKSFNSKSDVMLLNSNSDYFNYFKDQSGKKKK